MLSTVENAASTSNSLNAKSPDNAVESTFSKSKNWALPCSGSGNMIIYSSASISCLFLFSSLCFSIAVFSPVARLCSPLCNICSTVDPEILKSAGIPCD